MSVQTRRERKAERAARTARGGRGGPDETSLGVARATIRDAFDAKVDMGLLERDEQAEIVALCSRIQFSEQSPGPPGATSAEV